MYRIIFLLSIELLNTNHSIMSAIKASAIITSDKFGEETDLVRALELLTDSMSLDGPIGREERLKIEHLVTLYARTVTTFSDEWTHVEQLIVACSRFKLNENRMALQTVFEMFVNCVDELKAMTARKHGPRGCRTVSKQYNDTCKRRNAYASKIRNSVHTVQHEDRFVRYMRKALTLLGNVDINSIEVGSHTIVKFIEESSHVQPRTLHSIEKPFHRTNFDGEYHETIVGVNPLTLKTSKTMVRDQPMSRGAKFAFESREQVMTMLLSSITNAAPSAIVISDDQKHCVAGPTISRGNTTPLAIQLQLPTADANVKGVIMSNDPRIIDLLLPVHVPVTKLQVSLQSMCLGDRINSRLYKQYMDACVKLINQKINGTPHGTSVTCPRPECAMQSIVKKYSGEGSKEVTCSFCRRAEICLECGLLGHGNHACNAPDEATAALLAEHCPCPNKDCGVLIHKIDGCSHMECVQCKSHFCWECRTVYDRRDIDAHIRRGTCRGYDDAIYDER